MKDKKKARLTPPSPPPLKKKKKKEDVSRIQQMVMSNPRLMALMQRPGFMQKLQQHMSNPMAMLQSRDPDVMEFVTEMSRMQQGGGGGGGLGGSMNMMNMMNSSSSSGSNYQDHSSSGDVQELVGDNSNELKRILSSSENADKLIVIDWFATWCRPCEQIKGDYVRLAKFHKSKAVFLKVDVDKNPNLSRSYGIDAMPKFLFFKGGNKVDEMTGADVRQLERLIDKHVTLSEPNTKQNKPSPFESIPINANNVPVYAKAQLDKNADNAQLIDQILQTLQNKTTYHQSTLGEKHFELIANYAKNWPEKPLCVLLDLIRVLVLHPNASAAYAKNKAYVDQLVQISLKYSKNDTILCLVCRIFINLFSRQVTRQAMKTYFPSVETLAKICMKSEAVNTRSAFVQILSCYAFYWHVANEKESLDSLKVSHLLIDCLDKEQDASVAIKAIVTTGTLVFRSEGIAQALRLFDIDMLLIHLKKERFSKHSDVHKYIDELTSAINDTSL
ncbi:thioredoxin H-type 4 [Reticulomyxa filosa]|uniref:Thioredoxin H-type 4 n=1 Tax=Reticulomyxa filosa TaxID=46433 RepID=X6N1G3_RETFI|nr:thioredoxin H-type 4 [Reticulomyxa filosa]|eukprot:ETO19574.1 thioredoxin H-type 4 [Reticulomyxa filosa]